jgi:hypothetical protein
LELAEKQRQKELGQQRDALEKDKAMALLKLQAGFNREREALQRRVAIVEQQLQKKTANELGDGAEIDIGEALRAAFRNDRITPVPKGEEGADFLHEVLHKGQVCGRTIIESKNHRSWKNAFIAKLRHDQVEAGAEHAILATTAFPAGKKELCIESGVIVVSPARVIYVAELLRQAMVAMYVRGLSVKERANKMSKLYNLITSESYIRRFAEVARLADDILQLDVDEKKEHDRVWRKRGTWTMQVKSILREIDTDVAAVIEGEDEGSRPPHYAAQRSNVVA